jgi:hypothetical protein
LDEGSSVVIDNTNPSPAVRAEYLALAKVSISLPASRLISLCVSLTESSLCALFLYRRSEACQRAVSISPPARMWPST